jgi:hypothetical protein
LELDASSSQGLADIENLSRAVNSNWSEFSSHH